MMPRRSSKIPPGPVIKRILIRCPATAKLMITGLTTEASEFSGLKVTDSKLTCNHCGDVHAWTEGNVVLARKTEEKKKK